VGVFDQEPIATVAERDAATPALDEQVKECRPPSSAIMAER
jgi:hypothetical protein